MATPTVSLTGGSTITEGSSGTKYATYTVSLSSAATSAVKVVYSTSNGTATSGSDYGSTKGTLTIAAGSSKGTIQVPVYGDTAYESNETFGLRLTSATNGTLSRRRTVTTTITNDDTTATPTVSLSGPSSVSEGDTVSSASGQVSQTTGYATYVVSLSSAATTAVTVVYSTSNGTAAAGSDYGAATGTLTIAAGSSSGNILVPIYNDSTFETDETFSLKVTSATNATLSSSTSVTTAIKNDDTDYSLLFSSAMRALSQAPTAHAMGASSLSAGDGSLALDARKGLGQATALSWGITS